LHEVAGPAPILIAYDGSPSADHAIREAGGLLRGRQALVVAIYQQGVGFELAELPATSIAAPPAPIDIRTALEVDEELAERPQMMAQHGAELAREAGFEAEALAVADDADTPAAETIVMVAREQSADAIVMGAHGHSRLSEAVLGSTSRDVIRSAPCPVVIARPMQAR
jgi:nucleotide-binding universal stress UspA family protein